MSVFAGLGIASLLIALLVRVLFTYVCVLFADFNTREKVFIALAWIPKATVQVSKWFPCSLHQIEYPKILSQMSHWFHSCPHQAAIGSKALDMARVNGDSHLIQNGMDVLTVAVLSILLTAPIGALIIGLCGPRLLQKPKILDCGERVKPNLSTFFLGG